MPFSGVHFGGLKMRLRLVLVTFCALLTGPLFAAERASDDPFMNDLGYRGEFQRAGGGLVCVVGTLGPKVKPEDVSKIHYQPCLFIGPPNDQAIAIGGEAQSYFDHLGKPSRSEADAAGSVSHIYPLGDGDNPPFMVVTVMNNRIAAFQITGDHGLDVFAFNQVTLGSSSDKIRERFGEPMDRKDMGDGSSMWSYLPWPISFLVTDAGIVVSMRIANQQLK